MVSVLMLNRHVILERKREDVVAGELWWRKSPEVVQNSAMQPMRCFVTPNKISRYSRFVKYQQSTYAFVQKYIFCLRLNLGGRELLSVRHWRARRWAGLPDALSDLSSFSQTLSNIIQQWHDNFEVRQILQCAKFHRPLITRKKPISGIHRYVHRWPNFNGRGSV